MVFSGLFLLSHLSNHSGALHTLFYRLLKGGHSDSCVLFNSKPGYFIPPVRMVSLSSSANYYNHGTFPGLVNWLFVLTKPELTGELGDGDRKGMHSGGIIRWLGRPSSQLKPIFHARGRRMSPPPKTWQAALPHRSRGLSSREPQTSIAEVCGGAGAQR